MPCYDVGQRMNTAAGRGAVWLAQVKYQVPYSRKRRGSVSAPGPKAARTPFVGDRCYNNHQNLTALGIACVNSRSWLPGSVRSRTQQEAARRPGCHQQCRRRPRRRHKPAAPRHLLRPPRPYQQHPQRLS